MKSLSFLALLFISIMPISYGFAQEYSWEAAPLNIDCPHSYISNSSGEISLCIFISNNTIWRITNSGQTCLNTIAEFNDRRLTFNTLYHLSNDDSRVLLHATFDFTYNYFFISDDFGETWNEVTFENSINQYLQDVFIDPDNPDSIVLVSNLTTWFTSDGFQSVNRVNTISVESADVFKSQDHLFLKCDITLSDSRRSIICPWNEENNNWDFEHPVLDSFNEFASLNVFFNKVLPLSNGEFLVSIFGNEEEYVSESIFIYDSNWEQMLRCGSEFMDRVFPTIILEDSQNPGTLYLEGILAFKSTDYGRSWIPFSIADIPDYRIRPTFFYQQPTNHKIYTFIREFGLYTTNDNGLSWSETAIPEFSSSLDLRLLEDKVYLGNNWYRFDNESWEQLPFPCDNDTLFHPMQLFYFNEDSIFGYVNLSHHETSIGNTASFFALSPDAGNSWELIPCPENNYFMSIASGNGVTIVNHEFLDTAFEISTDFGASWSLHHKPSLSFILTKNYIYSLERSGDGSELVRLPIGHNDWESAGIVFYETPRHFRSYEESILVVEQDRNCWWCYENTWTQQGTLESIGITDMILFEYERELNVIVNNNHCDFLRRSTDRCNSWDYVYLAYPDEGYPDIEMFDLLYDDINRRLWVSTNIGAFWAPIEEALSTTEDPVHLYPADHELLTNYPNPFNASTKIQYFLTKPGNVKLDVYDITGRLVKTLENTYKPAGTQDIFLDGNGLASGTYFIRLNTGEEVRNHRITLVK